MQNQAEQNQEFTPPSSPRNDAGKAARTIANGTLGPSRGNFFVNAERQRLIAEAEMQALAAYDNQQNPNIQANP